MRPLNNDRVMIMQEGDSPIELPKRGYCVKGRGSDVVAFFIDIDNGLHIYATSKTMAGYPCFYLGYDEEATTSPIIPVCYIPELKHYSFHSISNHRKTISVCLVRDSEEQIKRDLKTEQAYIASLNKQKK